MTRMNTRDGMTFDDVVNGDGYAWRVRASGELEAVRPVAEEDDGRLWRDKETGGVVDPADLYGDRGTAFRFAAQRALEYLGWILAETQCPICGDQHGTCRTVGCRNQYAHWGDLCQRHAEKR